MLIWKYFWSYLWRQNSVAICDGFNPVYKSVYIHKVLIVKGLFKLHCNSILSVTDTIYTWISFLFLKTVIDFFIYAFTGIPKRKLELRKRASGYVGSSVPSINQSKIADKTRLGYESAYYKPFINMYNDEGRVRVTLG